MAQQKSWRIRYSGELSQMRTLNLLPGCKLDAGKIAMEIAIHLKFLFGIKSPQTQVVEFQELIPRSLRYLVVQPRELEQKFSQLAQIRLIWSLYNSEKKFVRWHKMFCLESRV